MTKWLPGGGRARSGRFRDAQGAGRGVDPRFRDRFRIAGGSASLDEFSDLVSWFDASDISTLWQDTAGTTQVANDGDTVKRWDDKIGAIITDVQRGSTQWTYRAAGLNSRETLEHVGVEYLNASTDVANTSVDWTLVFVGALDSLGSGAKAGPYILDFSSGRLIFALDYVDSPGDGPAVYDGAWRTTGSANTTGTPQVLVFRLDGAAGTGEIFRDGTSIGTFVYTGVDVDQFTGMDIGEAFNTTVDARYSELGLYDRALSDSEVTEVTDTMKTKWGIS